MLHITLDPSSLSKLEPGQTQAGEFTLSLSGVFWRDPGPQPAVPDLTEDHLYPWRWDLPAQVRLFWLDQNGAEVGAPANLALQAFAAGYQPDTDIIRDQVEQSLREAIFDQQGDVIPSKILSNITAQVVEVNDTSDPATTQGYFKGRIAELAQKTPPHNQGLRLVFLASGAGIIIPADATHFVLFPMGGTWWNWTNNRFTDVDEHVGYSYADTGAPVGVFRVYCPITIIDRSSGAANPNSPIRLVYNGAFYGQVRMGAGGVTDAEDWLPGLNYRAAQYLDLPARLLGYLHGAESVLSVTVAQAQEQDYVNYLQRIERFLLTMTRDMLGFGQFEEGDGGSLAKRAAAAFAAASGGGEEDQAALLRTLLGALEAHFPAKEPPDLATWRDLLSGAVSSYEETRAVAPDFGALAVVNPSAETLRKAVPPWLAAWGIVLQAMRGKDFSDRMVLLQWETSGQPAGLDATQWSGVKSALRTLLAELPASRVSQGDSLVTRYRARLLDIPTDVTAANIPKQIVNNLKVCLRQYAENRRDGVQPVQALRPAAEGTDPFASPPADMVGAPTWAGFVTFMNNDPLWTEAVADLFPGANKVYDIPPPVRVTVDRPGPEDDSSTGDLNDEISGHLIFSRRGAARGTAAAGQEWRSFNRVKGESRMKDNAGQIVSRSLALPLLVPAFMPEVSGARRCFLTLGNEALSLVAGQREKLENPNDAEPLQPGLSFIFDDPTHMAWALWYGYRYEFAGFVALNSGVLSAELRENAAVWNVPRTDFGTVDLAAPENQVEYSHYRRVGVSSVRVVNARDAQGEITNQIAPKEVRSIASELPEWIAGDAIRQEAKSGIVTPDRKWYLLTTQADATIFRQNSVTVALRKPSTSFWNWYAWAGKTATVPQKETAYTRDLLRRDRPFRESKTDPGLLDSALCDPAVEHRLVLLVECLFPVKSKSYYSVPFPAVGDMLLDDPEIQLTVTEAAQANLAVQVAGSVVQVTVPVGQVVRISCHAVLRRDDFTGGQKRFHEWMGITGGNPGGVLELTPDGSSHAQAIDSAITRPIELWFESAQAFPDDRTFPKEVWQSLTIRQNGDKVSAGLLRQQGNFARFALIGRIDVHHQVWNWNGRLIDTAQLAELARDQTQLDPSGAGPQTTLAMQWEAWAFSDRPDFARLTKECHLRLWRYDPPIGTAVDKVEDEEELFADHRPREEKALYYRFSATAYSRYAVLKGSFEAPVNTAVVVETAPSRVENPWRRYIRRASRSKPLPKPAIRFILPLTKSFNEKNGHASPDDATASLLIVLNDRWYAEAGLAEQLEVGVEVLKSPAASQLWYANAGYDPTLTGEALPGFERMPQINSRPAGPVGLTFDFAAQTPRLVGSAFILALPDEIQVGEGKEPLQLDEALKAWFMMRVSVRRKLYPELCEAPLPPREGEEENGNAAEEPKPLPTLDSPWTAPEWVQFLPSVDFIIPKTWRDQAKCQGHLNLRVADGFINVPNAQRFDRTFEERMERWLVVTQRVYDIGGQPCESYVATLAYRGAAAGAEAPELRFDPIDPPGADIRQLKDGYVRFILVRKRIGVEFPEGKSPWELLFGESANESPRLTGVEDDPGAASPIVSDRLVFRVI